MLYFNLNCSNCAKVPSTYKSLKVVNPLPVQISKELSITEGLNILFLDIGALINKSVNKNAGLKCIQSFRECLTTGLIEYLHTGSGNGSLEQSKECKVVGPHDKSSNFNHCWLPSSIGLSQCSIARILADQ